MARRVSTEYTTCMTRWGVKVARRVSTEYTTCMSRWGVKVAPKLSIDPSKYTRLHGQPEHSRREFR